MSADATDTLHDCAVRMHNRSVGALAVYRDGRLAGIVTERDVVRAVALGADPTTTNVARFMTPGPATVTPSSELVGAAWIMTKLGARHLPVTDAQGRPMGMLSARDIVAVLAEIGIGPDRRVVSGGV